MKTGTFSLTSTQVMELIDITAQVNELPLQKHNSGLLFLYNPHTTAGLTINEGADPDVRTDIIDGLRAMVPLDYPYKHLEGNAAAHLMATLTGASVTLAVASGRLVLGTWQRLFFCEYDGPRNRTLHWQILSSEQG